MHIAPLVPLLLFALLVAAPACRSTPDAPEECAVVEVAADKSTEAPRPDEKHATFYFPGNNPEQREFVIVKADGSYDYMERWNFGLPKKGTIRELDPRQQPTWEEDIPLIGKKAKDEAVELERLQQHGGVPPKLKVDWDDELQATFGWDWKVDCRMHVCMRDANACCHQHCRDGGAEGTAYEPPDQFACMNSSAGGHYDWFLIGLRDGGMTEIEACVPY